MLNHTKGSNKFIEH